MMLGQIRQVFDPDWIQSFDGGDDVLIKFREGSDAVPELERFAEMYGYEVERDDNDSMWERYYINSE
jgi:hypothetical protein